METATTKILQKDEIFSKRLARWSLWGIKSITSYRAKYSFQRWVSTQYVFGQK